MADIFLAYSRHDRKDAQKIASALELFGWSVFWDVSVPIGRRWHQTIELELHRCRCVVVLWTNYSRDSDYVLEEAEYGKRHGILIPILLDAVDLPYGFSRIQPAYLSDWDGSISPKAFQSVIDAIGALIGIPEKSNLSTPFMESRGGKKPLNEAKLILVGFGGVGKTSLVKRLVYRKGLNKREAMTEGIAINEWSLMLANGSKVNLHVWDFGGQEIMHATHQFFLTARSLYILVLNGRQGREDADAEYWLNLIKSFGAESPVIVVLNKVHELAFDVNRRALQYKFSNISAFVSTDCEDDTGISDLLNLIKVEVSNLSHLRDTFPASWFAIKDSIANMKDSYLSFEDYRRLCLEFGEADAEAQETLAGFLHSLGIALNYRDDPRLHDVHVLKPEWVTEGIYAILNAKKLTISKGELNLAELPSILNSDRYPIVRQSFLIELMRKFELCFRFPEEDGRYLIPELLDKQEPESTRYFTTENCLAFEYHYESALLPEGLIPRFIVRTSALSVGESRWRTGVILSFEGNRALVRGDPMAKVLDILVAGNSIGRRRLLAVIRSHLEEIHKSYAFRPTEMIPVPARPGLVIPYDTLLVLERNHRETHDVVYGEEVLSLNVRVLLNGVDLEGIRRPSRALPESNRKAVTAFISYSHTDESLRAELQTHLMLFKRQGLLAIWTDHCITAGEEWKGKIDENLEGADIIIFLISADFINSDYCWDIELERALQRHKSENARIIPIIVRSCLWQNSPIGRLQALPEGGQAVRTWGPSPQDRDPAWTKVAEGIEIAIKELLESSHSA